jgi:hypothetical protein
VGGKQANKKTESPFVILTGIGLMMRVLIIECMVGGVYNGVAQL